MIAEEWARFQQLLSPRPDTIDAVQGVPQDIRLQYGGGIENQGTPPISGNYQMQADPVVNPAPFEPKPNMLDLAVPPRALSQAEMQEGRGMRPEDILARDLFGEQVQLSSGDRYMLRMAMPQLAQQRQVQAMQIQQLQEQKRQHDLQLLEKTMANPRAPMMLEQLGQDPSYSLNKQALMLSKALKDTDYGSFEAYREFIPDDIQQRFLAGQLPYQELVSWIDIARESMKTNAKESAKATLVTRAMNKKPEDRTPFEQQLVEEREAAQAVKEADELLKLSQAAKNIREAEQGKPDHTTLGRIHQMVSGGKSFEEGTPATQRKALDEYAKLYPEGRTAVQMGTPAPLEKRVNVIRRSDFLKHGAMVQPPAGATEGQLRGGDYIEITDKQRDAWGEINNSGATLQALFNLVDPLITATTTGQALKQYGRLSVGAVSKKIPAATTYLADSEAFSSRMARVFGSEVGVLTQGDVNRWMRALPTFGDTVAVKEQKKKIFMDIYNQSRQMAMKKIAGEDITDDLAHLRTKTLSKVDAVNPPSIEDDLTTLFGTKP